MAMMNPPIRGQAFKFPVSLISQANANTFQVNPTLAAGDVKVTKDSGAASNIASLPTVPNSDTEVLVSLSAAEMDADWVSVLFKDAAGAEWCDQRFTLHTSSLGTPGTVNDASATTTGFVTSITGKGTDFFKDQFLLFTDGALQGQARAITAYNSTSGAVTVASAFNVAPANSDPFVILGSK